MFKYSLKNPNGRVTAIKWIEEDVENPWKSKFDKFGRKGFNGGHDRDWPAVVDDNGIELEPAIAKSMTIEKEDISAEIAAREAAEQARRDATARLKALGGVVPPPEAAKVLEDILEHLGLK